MGLAQNILANEKVMDKLAQIYASTLSAYYGNGKRGTDREAKNEMIYYLEQNCGVCQRPASISAQLDKILDKIQERAKEYGYDGPISQPASSAAPSLPSRLQEITNKVLADEQIMMALGSSCVYAAKSKHLVKGAMMSEKYWGSYPNELKQWVEYKKFGYVSFREAKAIINFIKKDIKKYAKLYEQQEAEKAAAEGQGGEMNEGLDELSPKLIQKAADKAWDMERYSQAEKFEDEAERRAGAEFGKDECIRRITPKSIAYVMADNSSGLIYRDGSYTFRPRSGYNNESGNLRGRSKFPDYMKVHDKHAARTISRWWKMYHDEGIEIPFIDDWHNLVKW